MKYTITQFLKLQEVNRMSYMDSSQTLKTGRVGRVCSEGHKPLFAYNGMRKHENEY